MSSFEAFHTNTLSFYLTYSDILKARTTRTAPNISTHFWKFFGKKLLPNSNQIQQTQRNGRPADRNELLSKSHQNKQTQENERPANLKDQPIHHSEILPRSLLAQIAIWLIPKNATCNTTVALIMEPFWFVYLCLLEAQALFLQKNLRFKIVCYSLNNLKIFLYIFCTLKSWLKKCIEAILRVKMFESLLRSGWSALSAHLWSLNHYKICFFSFAQMRFKCLECKKDSRIYSSNYMLKRHLEADHGKVVQLNAMSSYSFKLKNTKKGKSINPIPFGILSRHRFSQGVRAIRGVESEQSSPRYPQRFLKKKSPNYPLGNFTYSALDGYPREMFSITPPLDLLPWEPMLGGLVSDTDFLSENLHFVF